MEYFELFARSHVVLLDAGAQVIFGAGGLSGAMAIKYAAAPEGSVVEAPGSTCDGGFQIFNTTKDSPAVYVVGVDSDEFRTTFGSGDVPGADKIITSALKDVAAGVRLAIGNFFSGTATGRNFLLNTANGGVDAAPCNLACSSQGGPVTPAMVSKVEETRNSLAQGLASTRVDGLGACTAGPGQGCEQ